MTPHDDDPIPSDLADLIADLSPEVEPERDLWEGVRAEIEPVPAPAANRSFATLTRVAWVVAGIAAVVAIAVVSSTVTRQTLQAEGPRVSAAEPAEAVDQWEADVRQTTDELMGVLDSRRAGLDPEAVRVIEAALADIDAAIDDVHRALREDPDNEELEAALAGVYQRKVDLLRSAAELPAGG